MKKPAALNAPGLFIDIGPSSIGVFSGGEAWEFPIERGENGCLTDLNRERLTAGLRGFLGPKGRTARQTAWCAISARGVSLRRLVLPASSKEEFQRVLRLQIESEFPLSPDELAWGWRPAGPAKSSANGGASPQELLVVAVKKQLLEEYSTILAACGVTPLFTLAALARSELYPPPSGPCAVLDIGRHQSELMSFDNGVPASIRILPWGGETITRSIQDKLGIGHDAAEKLMLTLDQPGAASDAPGLSLQSAVESALGSLAGMIKPALPGGKLYLTGKSARDPRLAPQLTRLLGGAVACASLGTSGAPGPSSVIAGLMKATAKNSASPPLILEMTQGQGAIRRGRPPVWKWAAAAVLLALAALFFPYAEAIVLKPFLERKLAALQADRGRLATIDQELDFLKFLKENQTPYLDAIYLVAKSAPPGTRVDALSLGRHEEVSMRLKMATAQQVSDFRSKLIDSGWFGDVVVEDQTPSPDRRVAVRMTAELKPVENRKPLAAEPPAKNTDKTHPGGEQPGASKPPPEVQPAQMPGSGPKPAHLPPPTNSPTSTNSSSST